MWMGLARLGSGVGYEPGVPGTGEHAEIVTTITESQCAACRYLPGLLQEACDFVLARTQWQEVDIEVSSGSPAAGLQWLTLIARECAAVACRNDQTRLSSSRFSVTARR